MLHAGRKFNASGHLQAPQVEVVDSKTSRKCEQLLFLMCYSSPEVCMGGTHMPTIPPNENVYVCG